VGKSKGNQKSTGRDKKPKKRTSIRRVFVLLKKNGGPKVLMKRKKRWYRKSYKPGAKKKREVKTTLK